MLPNLFLVGTARAGTTSLWRYLARHPAVFFPALKEPKFFSADDNRFPHCGPNDHAVDARVVRTWPEYRRLFDEAAGASVIGDASIDSLYFPGALRRIRERCPDARIVISLRDPVDRAFSAYKYLVLSGRETLTFENALDREAERRADNWEFIWHYQAVGDYAAQVRRSIETFGRDRVHVIFFDELVKRPAEAVAPVFAAFGLEAPALPVQFGHLERSTVPVHPVLRAIVVQGANAPGRVRSWFPRAYDKLRSVAQRACRRELTLSPATRARLRRRYAADRRDLEETLGRRLPWGSE